MPFKSKAQARAAFGGYLGPEMKAKSKEFANATGSLKNLPEHVAAKPQRGMPGLNQMRHDLADMRKSTLPKGKR